MSKYNFKTIVVKGDGIRKEGKLHADSNDILPGCFIRRVGDNFDEIKDAATNSPANAIAIEAETFGTGIDTAYDTDGERVLYHVLHSGCEAFCLLRVGQNVAVGAALEVHTNGYLTATGSGPTVALAMEAVNNSAGSGPARILVEIL